MFSSTEYNSTIFESHLLISFSNKNPWTLLADLVRAGTMVVEFFHRGVSTPFCIMEFTNILLEKFTTNVGMQCPLLLSDKTTVNGDYFCSLPLIGFSSSGSGKFLSHLWFPLAFFTVYQLQNCSGMQCCQGYYFGFDGDLAATHTLRSTQRYCWYSFLRI